MLGNMWIRSLWVFALVIFVGLGTIGGCHDDGGGGGQTNGGDGGEPPPDDEPPPGGGIMPGDIPQKILDLRPLRGVAYVPSPSDFRPGCVGILDPPTGDPQFCRYFDSDWANDDFRGLWSSENPGGTGPGRADLESMKNNLNVNFVRLYDWGAPPFRKHINFLNEANRLGIKVAVPISNFTLQCIRGDQDCNFGDGVPTIENAKNNVKNILEELITNGSPHEAINMWTIGNEWDLGGFNPDVVATAIQFLIEAEEELGVTDEANKLPITVPTSFGTFGAPADQPGIVKTEELMNAISNNPKALQILNTRFFVSLQTFNDDIFLKTYLQETFPQKFPDLALLITELGINFLGSGGAQNEASQAAFVKNQLDLCQDMITNRETNPNNYFLGCTYFEWLNSLHKGFKTIPVEIINDEGEKVVIQVEIFDIDDTEITFGAHKHTLTLLKEIIDTASGEEEFIIGFEAKSQGMGRTVDVPTSGPQNYPIDELVEKLVFFSIMEAFMN